MSLLLVGLVHAADDPAEIREAVFRRKVVASDGVSLALYRYVPAGGGLSKPPVLLVPDVWLGRESFDASGEGLAVWLQAKGREVYVAELRGQGRAESPDGWKLTDWVSRDLPAMVAAIQNVRPGPVDVVAHGYSGALLMAASVAELNGKVNAVVALSTPVEPEVPNRTAEKILAGGGRLTQADRGAFELLFTRGGRFAAGRVGQVKGGVMDLSKPAADALLSWMRTGDLALADGTTVRKRWAKYDRPTLLFLPLGDNFAHPEFASPLRELALATVTVKVLSRLDLLDEDYTHLSLLHGEKAARDVFTPALSFLDTLAPSARRPEPR